MESSWRIIIRPLYLTKSKVTKKKKKAGLKKTIRFYNIEKWEKRQEAIRMGEHYTDDRFDFAKDEERLR